MNLFKTSILSGIAQIIRIVTGIIVTKVIAVLIGPTGVAVIGQLQNILNLSTLFSGDFLKTALLRFTAKYNQSKSKDLADIWSAAFTIFLILSLTTSTLLYLYSKSLAIYFLKDESYQIILKTLAFSLPFFVLNSLLLAILNGLKNIKLYILISILNNIVSLILVCSLSYFYGLKGSLFAYVTNQSVVFLITVYLIRQESWFKPRKFRKQNFDKIQISKQLVKFSFITFTAIASSSLSMLYIRSFMIESLSIETTGIWQALWTLSNLFSGLITTALGTYILPTMSGITDKELLNKEIKAAFKILIPLSLFGLVLLYLLRDIIILTLYSAEFTIMRDLIGWQLLGTLFKILAWLFSISFVSQGLVKISVIVEIFFALSWCILMTIFVNKFNLDGATYAFALNSLLYLVVVATIYKKRI